MKLLARNDPHAALFDAYASTLPELASNDETRVQCALRAFELTLLRQTGQLPDLSLVTQTQEAVCSGDRYGLWPEAGVAVARGDDGEIAGDTLIGLQAALQHGSMEALQQACHPARAELKGALRGMIQYHLGSAILRSRRVMMDVQKLPQGSAS
jgi:DNA repair protein RecO (recombination protein O)